MRCLIRQKGYFCSAHIRRSGLLQIIHGFSALVTLFVAEPALINLYFKPVRQRIYDRSTYTVQTTGYFVSATAEFSAGMKYGKYDFYCRFSCFMIDYNTLKSRLREMAFLTKGIKIVLHDDREEEPVVEAFYYEGGIKEYVEYLNRGKEPLCLNATSTYTSPFCPSQ